MQQKTILRSKTIIGGILMLIPAVFALLGLESPTEAEMRSLQDHIFLLVEHGGSAVGFLMVLWGRLTAATRLRVF